MVKWILESLLSEKWNHVWVNTLTNTWKLFLIKIFCSDFAYTLSCLSLYLFWVDERDYDYYSVISSLRKLVIIVKLLLFWPKAEGSNRIRVRRRDSYQIQFREAFVFVAASWVWVPRWAERLTTRKGNSSFPENF